MWYFLSNLSSLMSQKERILFERKVIGYYSVGAVEIVRIYQGTNAYRDKFHSCWGTQIICVLSWSLLSLKWFDFMPKNKASTCKQSLLHHTVNSLLIQTIQHKVSSVTPFKHQVLQQQSIRGDPNLCSVKRWHANKMGLS